MGRAYGMYSERRGAYKVSVGKPDGNVHFEELGADERVI